MPDISNTYQRMADNVLASLKSKCSSGVYSEHLFKTVMRGLNKFYSLDKLEWMKQFLGDRNQHIATGCLECLCSHGASIADFHDVLQLRIRDTVFSSKAIELAEKQNSPDTLLLYMDESYGYVNRVILALKKTHNESYLTTLMLSENDSLVKSIDRITKNL